MRGTSPKPVSDPGQARGSRKQDLRTLARSTLAACLLTLGSSSLCAQQQPENSSTTALKRLSVEELMDVQVTSVSKSRESLAGAAAAVAIVSNEDIRRSGATTLPDALRFVPGLHVANETADSWVVSSRGFSGVNSAKLLVLSDTRSIYTPLFSGVFWEAQDYFLEDIDHIEVIRGPGAALWGSNAVNGVINILTKNAADTQGEYLETAAGTQERVSAAARYGGESANHLYYRVFGKYFDQGAAQHPAGSSPDDWQLGHVGFRADWHATSADALTVQGDAYDGRVGQVAPAVNVLGRPGPVGKLRAAVGGANVLGRWQHSSGENADIQLRLYYDRTHRNDPTFLDDLDTVDLDFQQRFTAARAQELTWGLNYRSMHDRNVGKGIFNLQPASSRDNLVSGFVQDQISLRDSLRVTLGTKLEHNDFSGFEVQPSVRAAWDLSRRRTVWGAVSRAVRVPTRIERDVAIDVTNPLGNPVARLLGNRDFHAEELLAFELGYRWQALENLSCDLAAFHNRYHGLASLEFGTPFIDPNTGQTVFPVLNRNLTDARTEGFEALATYSPRRYWRLSLTYTYTDMSLDPHGQDLNRGRFTEGATPRNQIGVRSSLDLPGGFQVDAQLRSLSAIRSSPDIVTGQGIPGYNELDVRLAWQAWKQLEISVDGRNLLHDHHVEFGAPDQRSAMERSVYGKIAWGF
ncbi:MAG: TonB-dependent receptor [Gammaproteobacteria bacterium]|nr:MAG: TonB-dependent receptor [Gammaproteobacteria bacterium]